MRLNTRFLITIFTIILGFLTVIGAVILLFFKISHLNQADVICQQTINSLKNLQIHTSELLVTNELEISYQQWCKTYEQFQDKLNSLNTSPFIHSLLVSREQTSILEAMNIFWIFTSEKTARVKKHLSKMMTQKKFSRDGLIYQYADSKNHDFLIIRNDIITAKDFLESEYEVRLSKLISILDAQKAERLKILYYQFTILVLTIVSIVSTILITFLLRLKRSLGNLHRSMEKIGKGDFSEKLPVTGNDELSRIAQAINKTTDELSDMHIELKGRIEELSEAKTEADLANQAKSVFLANMSHEIRTPLNAVTGFSELLSGLVKDDQQKSYLSAIKQAGKSLLVLINDILDLSKIESGKLETNCTFIDLRTLLAEVRQIFEAQAANKKIAFKADISDGLPVTLCLDEIRLRQVMFNIVGNAVKFTQSGYIRISADVDKQEQDTIDLKLTIEDTGIGIHENEIESIFHAFRQQAGQDNSIFGGTGLGLTISKRLVEIMNGRIYVQSTVGLGSKFTVILKSIKYKNTINRKNLISSDHITVKFVKQTVLVVDDAHSNRKFLKELLTQFNLDVKTAKNGLEAVQMSNRCQPALILMNIQMPVMNGFQALAIIKSNPETADIPVIAVSACVRSDDAVEQVQTQFDASLPKPVKIPDLILILRRYLPIEKQTIEKDNGADLLGRNPLNGLSDELASKLPEIRNILCSDHLILWKEIKDRLPMEDVKSFGLGLKKLGSRYNFIYIKRYGSQLISSVDSFNINGMQSLMDAFPEIIEQLPKEIK